MDIRKIRKLIELLEETGISEIEIKEGEESLRLSRHSSIPVVEHPQVHYAVPPVPQAASLPVGSTSNSTAGTTPQESKSTASTTSGHQINSPMVGTMYTSPSPESPPFVTIGQTVKAGDVLCIVEAMKMFNEIEADRAGKIVEILVNNGEPVEYGQVLFIIE
ncbi:acetyl-CoA carboxylase biotin carboxyl carrier protein [Legionella longbeachae]|uniref:Biotin carboxyl carrier protein of acetyl-CoA carboxylase n=1 Tax=Legionella longbeachae serogroup 1 (strain NSW150) TaxID=661367 RepID=D3HL35_LEGLN|nr:acetyl-CoA carboxylase biotin carboxyl carrier protein [Legionella longbeachae]VEE03661.1 acetyl-CoA carboxylase biotin carboxyl carrier protein [Legionella oakridgensis]HBD7397533.1 acetyl-CoA carboxylase biotin carboxyl carrier protein [Legionella pneumophila]ARB93456.1 acetyl-CoA carboxylase biotin carboxyl carrier protein [Legionella longbeachae]ARM33440.1 acetyl-CoA carboxylase biotin carboxyl carrier protein [Legionella longbeachae]EEZ93712.1 acetyl-CoA carboxylase biotin carboxyl car